MPKRLTDEQLAARQAEVAAELTARRDEEHQKRISSLGIEPLAGIVRDEDKMTLTEIRERVSEARKGITEMRLVQAADNFLNVAEHFQRTMGAELMVPPTPTVAPVPTPSA